MREATIVSVEHQIGSGLASLVVKDDAGNTIWLHGDVRPLFYSLDAAFGSIPASYGRRIEYSLTDFGALAGFNPLD